MTSHSPAPTIQTPLQPNTGSRRWHGPGPLAVMLLALLTWACQLDPEASDGTQPATTSPEASCFEPAERRDPLCEPLGAAVVEASDAREQEVLGLAFSDCVETFEIADELCAKSEASEPAPCLDVLESKLSCFDLALAASSVAAGPDKDQLLDEVETCTTLTQSQLAACLDGNLAPRAVSCQPLEGHGVCDELIEAAGQAETEADRDHLLSSYEICIAYMGRAYSECAVGDCANVSDSSDVCQLFLDASYRVEGGRSADDLEDEYLACGKVFIELHRECSQSEPQASELGRGS